MNENDHFNKLNQYPWATVQYYPVITVTTDKANGPRGAYFDWCKIYSDGSLEFGDEQGNYAGGTTLSPTFYPGRDNRCAPAPPEHQGWGYWDYVKDELKRWRKEDFEFYKRIVLALIARGTGLYPTVSPGWDMYGVQLCDVESLMEG